MKSHFYHGSLLLKVEVFCCSNHKKILHSSDRKKNHTLLCLLNSFSLTLVRSWRSNSPWHYFPELCWYLSFRLPSHQPLNVPFSSLLRTSHPNLKGIRVSWKSFIKHGFRNERNKLCGVGRHRCRKFKIVYFFNLLYFYGVLFMTPFYSSVAEDWRPRRAGRYCIWSDFFLVAMYKRRFIYFARRNMSINMLKWFTFQPIFWSMDNKECQIVCGWMLYKRRVMENTTTLLLKQKNKRVMDEVNHQIR